MTTIISEFYVALALAASAQQAPQSDVDADAAACQDTEEGTRICEFENDTISGDTLSPEGKIIQSRPAGRHASLIRIREHFVPELVELARDL